MDPHELGLGVLAWVMVRVPCFCQLPVAVSYLLNSGLFCQWQHLQRKRKKDRYVDGQGKSCSTASCRFSTRISNPAIYSQGGSLLRLRVLSQSILSAVFPTPSSRLPRSNPLQWRNTRSDKASRGCTPACLWAKAETRTHLAVLPGSQTGSTAWLWCCGKCSSPAEQRRPARLGRACKDVDLGTGQTQKFFKSFKCISECFIFWMTSYQCAVCFQVIAVVCTDGVVPQWHWPLCLWAGVTRCCHKK